MPHWMGSCTLLWQIYGCGSGVHSAQCVGQRTSVFVRSTHDSASGPYCAVENAEVGLCVRYAMGKVWTV